jgi:hypothetical protein
MREREARQARQRRIYLAMGAGVLVIVAAVGIVLAIVTSSKNAGTTGSHPALKTGPLSSLGHLQSAPNPGTNGFEGVPIPPGTPLGSTSNGAKGSQVDGIRCQRSEKLAYHIHSHLVIFVNGVQRQVAGGIGIPGSHVVSSAQGPVATGGTCLYWLHTHAPDGIIHVESPVHRTYTLGDFFDEWGQSLGPSVLGPYKGHVVALYDGKVYEGNPRNIPLYPHAQVQLEVGKPLVAPETITFPNGL